MRRGADAQIGRKLPLGRVVARLFARQREVGNLILLVAVCLESVEEHIKKPHRQVVVDLRNGALIAQARKRGALLVGKAVGCSSDLRHDCSD